MEQFSLEKWLQDKSRKVITRDGRIVEILKVDAKGNHPIIGIYQFSDTEDMESSWSIDGKKTENGESSFDLFFADEELTGFEKELQIIISEASHWTSEDGSISTYCQFGDKEIKKISGQLLDLARKELKKEFKDEEYFRLITEHYKKGKQDALKGLPKWRRDCFHNITSVVDGRLYYNDYYIDINELEKLPKEE